MRGTRGAQDAQKVWTQPAGTADWLDVLEQVSELPRALEPLTEELLANMVMLGQIPAPTGEEAARVRYVLGRFAEAGLAEVGADEVGNALALLPGRTGTRTIALVAHLDTVHPADVDHNVTVQADHVAGPGLADNALGASLLALLPTILEQLGLEFDSHLQLVGTVSSLHRGDHQGLRHVLAHPPRVLDVGVVVEGVPLGRLNFFSVAAVRGDITCDVRPEPLRRYGSESALVVLNQIVNRILGIPIPARPFTKIILGRMEAGTRYNVEPERAVLGFEVVSDSDETLSEVVGQIETIVEEMSARSAVDVGLDCFFHRETGGLPFSHPLIRTVIEVMDRLEIAADQEHDPSEVSEFVTHGIPAVTLGLTTVDPEAGGTCERVLIDPILVGVAQLIGVLLAIDRGAVDAR